MNKKSMKLVSKKKKQRYTEVYFDLADKNSDWNNTSISKAINKITDDKFNFKNKYLIYLSIEKLK